MAVCLIVRFFDDAYYLLAIYLYFDVDKYHRSIHFIFKNLCGLPNNAKNDCVPYTCINILCKFPWIPNDM